MYNLKASILCGSVWGTKVDDSQTARVASELLVASGSHLARCVLTKSLKYLADVNLG